MTQPDQITPEEATTTAAKPAATFVNAADRTRGIDLRWPVEFDGQRFERINIRRMTAADVANFLADIETKGSAARLPIFDCPVEVLDALDADDDERLQEAVLDFLPQRLRMAFGSHPQNGDGSSA